MTTLRSPAGSVHGIGDTGCQGSTGFPSIGTNGLPTLGQTHSVTLASACGRFAASVLCGAVEAFAQLLSGLEEGDVLLRDLDRVSGARIAADTRFAAFH